MHFSGHRFGPHVSRFGGRFEGHFGLWGLLGTLLLHLETLVGYFGSSWEHFGVLVGALWVLLGTFWGIMCSGSALEGILGGPLWIQGLQGGAQI